MEAALIFVVIGVIAGVAVGLQSPLASLIGQRLGLLESVFIVHLGGLVAAGVPLLLRRGGDLANWHTLPWYALIAGVFGLVVVGAVNLTIPRLGATTTVVLIVVGQLMIGLAIDQFGWLSITARPIDLVRVLGLVLLFAGTYLIVR